MRAIPVFTRLNSFQMAHAAAVAAVIVRRKMNAAAAAKQRSSDREGSHDFRISPSARSGTSASISELIRNEPLCCISHCPKCRALQIGEDVEQKHTSVNHAAICNSLQFMFSEHVRCRRVEATVRGGRSNSGVNIAISPSPFKCDPIR